jgi:hypothetical protein
VALKKRKLCHSDESSFAPRNRRPCPREYPRMALRKPPLCPREEYRMFPKKRPPCPPEESSVSLRKRPLSSQESRVAHKIRPNSHPEYSRVANKKLPPCPGFVHRILWTRVRTFPGCHPRNFSREGDGFLSSSIDFSGGQGECILSATLDFLEESDADFWVPKLTILE